MSAISHAMAWFDANTSDIVFLAVLVLIAVAMIAQGARKGR